MIDFKIIEKRFLDDLEIDYVPLNDVVRLFAGFDNAPNESDFINTLKFLEYVIDENNIKCLGSSEMLEIKKSTQEFLFFLRQKWYSGEYNQIDYSIWFEKRE